MLLPTKVLKSRSSKSTSRRYTCQRPPGCGCSPLPPRRKVDPTIPAMQVPLVGLSDRQALPALMLSRSLACVHQSRGRSWDVKYLPFASQALPVAVHGAITPIHESEVLVNRGATVSAKDDAQVMLPTKDHKCHDSGDVRCQALPAITADPTGKPPRRIANKGTLLRCEIVLLLLLLPIFFLCSHLHRSMHARAQVTFNTWFLEHGTTGTVDDWRLLLRAG